MLTFTDEQITDKCNICRINLPNDGYELCQSCYERSKLTRIHRDLAALLVSPPPATSLPPPPPNWLSHDIKKDVHKLIRNYPGKYNYEQISKILQNNSNPACNELIKNGYIRQTSGGTFLATKPFV